MAIFHYTDLFGLKGILDSNSLWATNIYFLNDKEESNHGCECFRNTIKIVDGNIIPKDKKTILLKSLDMYEKGRLQKEKGIDKHVYSISFCKENDKLSQWRGYGNKQGVCIEFDADELVSFSQNIYLNCVAHDVIYSNNNDITKMSKELGEFFSCNGINIKEMNDHFVTMVSTYQFISKYIPFFKHPSFIEENEFRLVFTPWMQMPDVHFRINNNGIIPYIIIDNKDNRKLPIKSITIGPTNDYDFIEAGIKMFLDSRGFSSVEIKSSSIPFRG
ncbi:TPA: DUF2971 domain-containing protein [Escherichia coli]|uniref:DUF2971 domain-containing protein n=1 Tax=Escherichia coli TaxID=562 RepID=UPI00073D8587|nr:DUF2971 domain-containing protein [Escherichia coli]EEY5312120.1 DUF2971 domain-containing protein [Escherichia coli]KUG91012.1 hypothetical protein ARC95_05045 [Escherichia coli]MBH0316158.1 DUF2971 domain-containing protein [Escherichia coli]MBK2580260.1 DUF2971 domain-containing protein [Escherichia coli]MBV4558544.1 DUF2971 domain-containing protein [Escherichia coli]